MINWNTVATPQSIISGSAIDKWHITSHINDAVVCKYSSTKVCSVIFRLAWVILIFVPLVSQMHAPPMNSNPSNVQWTCQLRDRYSKYPFLLDTSVLLTIYTVVSISSSAVPPWNLVSWPEFLQHVLGHTNLIFCSRTNESWKLTQVVKINQLRGGVP